jgi:protease-4
MDTNPQSPRPEPPVLATAVDRYPPQRRWTAARVIGWLAILVAIGFVGMTIMGFLSMTGSLSTADEHHIDEKFHSLNRHATDKIAIITVEGTILEADGFTKKQIDRVRDDKHVKAVVLRVNSPGGTVTGSDYLYHHLTRLRKERDLPIVVSMGSIAASGGYYLSMACGQEKNVIFAEPTTWTGSIGVVIPHYDVSELAERFGVSEDAVKSHRLKQMGSPLKKMTEEERQIFQALVDESFTRFKGIIQSGRERFQKNPAELDKVATGQVFTTRQAIDSGLVDKEGFIEDAIDRAVELAGIKKANARAVKYHEPFSLFDGLLGQARAAQPPSPLNLTALLDLATPRAWYLCSWPSSMSPGH